MDYLVVVRHGEYNSHRSTHPHHSLTFSGQTNMQRLGRSLEEKIPREGLQILSSPLQHACESAYILADTFGTKSAEHKLLQVDLDYWSDEIGRLILFIGEQAQTTIRTLLLVTHCEYACALLPRIVGEIFKRESPPDLTLDYAEAAILDWKTGGIETIIPYAWKHR